MASSRTHIIILSLFVILFSGTASIVLANQDTARAAQRIDQTYGVNYLLDYLSTVTVYWDIPENTEALQVYITNSSGNQDLFLKFGSAVSGSIAEMQASADYLSTGPSWDESVSVDAFSTPPLQQGRYYCTVLNYNNLSTSGRINYLATLKEGFPLATTLAASNLGRTIARLNGTVNPNDFQTTCHFEYGPTESYGQTTDEMIVEPGSSVQVNADIFGLEAGGEHHYRLVAENEIGVSHGRDVSFTTATQAQTRLFYPHFDTTNTWVTEFCANNLGDASVSGSMLLYDNNGDIAGEQPVTVPAFGSVKIDVGSQFGVSTSGYGVFEFPSGLITGYTAYSKPAMFKAALPAVPETAIASGKLYAAHIDSDSKWWTGMAFVNTGPDEMTFDLDFDDGSSASVTLPPYGHKALGVRDLFGGSAIPGANVATISPAQGLIGFELFAWGSQLAGIPLLETGGFSLQFPFLPKGGAQWAGLALYNPNNEPVTLNMFTNKSDGEGTSDQLITLMAGEKLVGMPSDLGIPPESDWCEIFSVGLPIHGFFLLGDTAGNHLAGASNIDRQSLSGTFMDVRAGAYTELFMANVQENAALVFLHARNSAGEVLAQGQADIPGYGSLVISAQDIFGVLPQDVSSITYSSNQALAAFQRVLSPDGLQAHILPAAIPEVTIFREGQGRNLQ